MVLFNILNSLGNGNGGGKILFIMQFIIDQNFKIKVNF